VKIADVAPGTPATIVIYQDTRAAVVVRRTPKRVIVALVELDESTRKHVAPGTPDPGHTVKGDLTKIIEGSERTYTLKEDSTGKAYATSGDYGRLSLGHSVEYRASNV